MLKHIKLFEAFSYQASTENNDKVATRFSSAMDLAIKNGMDEECIALIAWWGSRGYLNYASLQPNNKITETGAHYLESMYMAFKDGVYNDFLQGDIDVDGWAGTSEEGYEDPIYAEENIYKYMGKGYLDNMFESNLTTVKVPMKVWKNYHAKDERYDTNLKIGRKGWNSFSIHKDFYKGAFGDNYIGFELLVGAKFLDTYSGLADTNEVIINGADLKEEWIIQEGYSEEPLKGEAREKQLAEEFDILEQNRKVK